jgi:hypothetical protein
MATVNYVCLNDKSLNEAIQKLGYTFRRFNFPDGIVESGASSEADYLRYARTLFGLDDSHLIQLAEDTIEEYELLISMSDNDTSDGLFLFDFTQRLKKAVEERWPEMGDLTDEYFQVDEPVECKAPDVSLAIANSQRGFEPTLSFSSTLRPSQDSASQEYFGDDWSSSSLVDTQATPSASMSRMGNSPTTESSNLSPCQSYVPF